MWVTGAAKTHRRPITVAGERKNTDLRHPPTKESPRHPIPSLQTKTDILEGTSPTQGCSRESAPSMNEGTGYKKV